MAKSTPPPGTADIFPEEISRWYNLEDTARKVFSLYGFGELRTPIFEYTEVFKRGLGDATEVVQKEMYTFEDRGGRSMTLRPEGTASVMRALLNTDVLNGNEKRVYYIGPMFRGERPAAGRRRQFHQIGVENVGRVAPELDAENIAMLMHYLEELKITGAELLINTRGVEKDRIPAAKMLKEYFGASIDTMCDDCKVRLENNVWRILDCKQTACQEFIESAPDVVECFTEETKEYFKRVCEILDSLGVKYTVDKRLVRGLDYYVHTVFELTHPGLGAQNAIAGGGRYEVHLPQQKKPLIGVGFAAGLERLIMAQEALRVINDERLALDCYIVSMGDAARAKALELSGKLRKANIAVIAEVESKSMKAQMRSANRLNAKHVVIIGESELEDNVFVVKNMSEGTQETISFDTDINEITKYFA
ncbi:histidine--tRNA ligase [Lentisphaerota bacterium WC36G]|nr:histidine--tRNA ligase [Lentisphaerae bacterium WC36]